MKTRPESEWQHLIGGGPSGAEESGGEKVSLLLSKIFFLLQAPVKIRLQVILLDATLQQERHHL